MSKVTAFVVIIVDVFVGLGLLECVENGQGYFGIVNAPHSVKRVAEAKLKELLRFFLASTVAVWRCDQFLRFGVNSVAKSEGYNFTSERRNQM